MVDVVSMRGVTKRFPAVVANDCIDFDLRAGEIHALLGENGAGKTTLMNVLYGLYPPDAGEINIFGKPTHFLSPRDAIACGLGMVHQHFMLVDSFTVAENIIMGQPSPRQPLLENRNEVHQRLRDLGEQYGLNIEPEAEVWTLSVGEQQRVEILKSLYRGAQILILDEPTAVLTPQEAGMLLSILRQLASQGKSIVFISHKLDEVLDASDRITVLRDGKKVGLTTPAETDKANLARMMVGRDVILKVLKERRVPGETRLIIENLNAYNNRGLPALRNINLSVRSGEILGIAGVAGNGQSELEEIIAGLIKCNDGRIMICGEDATKMSPHDRCVSGLGHIPSDRYKLGILSDFSVMENLVLQRIGDHPFTKRYSLQWDIIRGEAINLVDQYDIRTHSVTESADTLSGGNAQKMILAREISRNPKVLLAAQPTRGLDVSAIEYVHRSLIHARDFGAAVLLISNELDEILNLSDRIAVIFEGQIRAVPEGDHIDLESIGLMMAGSKSSSKP